MLLSKTFLGLGLAFLQGALGAQLSVDLEASWVQLPYALEIIEAIAHENSTAYFPMVSALIGIEEMKPGISDEGLHKALLDHALEMGFISPAGASYVNTSVALHRHSALIESNFQYYESSIVPRMAKEKVDTKNCQNALDYNLQLTCDPGAVFALKTTEDNKAKSDTSKDQLLPTDRILGSNPKAPLAILYADVTSDSFPKFHAHLASSAMSGKIRYVLRYKAQANSAKLPRQSLAGYGIELNLKRTDYLVIDDRMSKGKDKKNDEDQTQPSQAGSVSKSRLAKLGLRAVDYILKSSTPFETLRNVSLRFPDYATKVAETDPSPKIKSEIKSNQKRGILNSGQNALLINGAHAFIGEDNAFDLLDVIDQERATVNSFAPYGIDNATAVELISKNILAETVGDYVSRYDYRTESLIWLNDIEADRQYSQLPSDLNVLLEDADERSPNPVRHNIDSVVIAADLSAPDHQQLLSHMFGLLNSGLPIQVGVIPLATSPEGAEIAKRLLYLHFNADHGRTLNFLAGVLSGYDYEEVLGNVLPDAAGIEGLFDNIELPHEWARRFDVQGTAPVMFANGIMLRSIQRWMQEASVIFLQDRKIVKSWVSDGTVSEEESIRDQLIAGSSDRRNAFVTPSNPFAVKYVDIGKITETISAVDADLSSHIPQLTVTSDKNAHYSTYWVVGDFADERPLQQLIEVVKFLQKTDGKENIRVKIIPVVESLPRADSATDKRRLVASSVASRTDLSLNDYLSQLKAVHEHFYVQNESEESKERLIDVVGIFDQNLEALVKQRDLSEAVLYALSLQGVVNTPLLLSSGRVMSVNKRMLDVSDLIELQRMEKKARVGPIIDQFDEAAKTIRRAGSDQRFEIYDGIVSRYTRTFYFDEGEGFYVSQGPKRISTDELESKVTTIKLGDSKNAELFVTAVIDPLSEQGQRYVEYVDLLSRLPGVHINVHLNPELELKEMPLKRYYKAALPSEPLFSESGKRLTEKVELDGLSESTLFTMGVHAPSAWVVMPFKCDYDLDNIILENVEEDTLSATYQLENILIEGHARDITTNGPPRGLALELGTDKTGKLTDTIVMANLGYLQFQSNPGAWRLSIKEGRSSEIFDLASIGASGFEGLGKAQDMIFVSKLTGTTVYPRFKRKPGMESADVLDSEEGMLRSDLLKGGWNKLKSIGKKVKGDDEKHAEVNIFSVASGHLYERFLSIMTASVMRHSKSTVKFWIIENFLSPSFKEFLPHLAEQLGFQYELVTYKWPHWLRGQTEKQRTIWGYKILFLDVLFPQSLDKVIFVDADQIVRTDFKELTDMDLQGAPYGFTPMCDSRTEIEGFRFWKQGFWKEFLGPKYKYHISALYVVDLDRFRKLAAGDRLRQHYQQLSADPNSLSNLDQDLPNHLQKQLPIFSLPQDWLWCETWCSDESLLTAKTIDLCNNPMTKEPKLDRAKRQVPEWIEYDNQIADLVKQFESSRDDQAEEPEEIEIEDDGVELDHDEL